MDFVQVDVFARGPYGGNPLAVFPRAEGINANQMQRIAREMNLSETSFVTSIRHERYDVRIFTPLEELPFAGHPTIGTAWVLLHLGLVSGTRLTQRSAAGETPVTKSDNHLFFERPTTSASNLEDTKPDSTRHVARMLRLDTSEIGLEARELGRSGRLVPATADAGIEQLMVPVRDPRALGRCFPDAQALAELAPMGAYCFTAVGAGRLQARGFFPSLGIPEDPATGSAAAALGGYLSTRLGPIEVDIAQGVEMGRPSAIHVRAADDRVRVGGACHLIFEAALRSLPDEALD